jgi:DNA-binding beta-propeller fold protein YncE
MQKSTLGKCVLGLVAGALSLNAQAVSTLYVSDTFANNVHVINTATNTEVVAPIPISHEHPLAPVASKDGRYVYVQTVDGSISVIDTRLLAVARTFDDPNPQAEHGAASMTLSPDGAVLYAIASGTGDIARIDTTTGTVTSRIAGNSAWGPSPTIRASHDGQRLYVLAGGVGRIGALDANTGELIADVDIALAGALDSVAGFALTPDDATIAAVTYLGDFVLVDTSTMTISSTEQLNDTLYGIDLSPDGSHVFIAKTNDYCMIDFAMPNGAVNLTSWGSNGCFAVGAVPDGHHVYFANYDVGTDLYSVTEFDRGSRTVSIGGTFGYPNFDNQSFGPVMATPQAGVWWNSAESGRSFNIEVRHATLVLTAQAYDADGAPTWLLASGPYDAASGTFSGTFTRYAGGQCLGCAYRAPQGSPVDNGEVQLVFSSDTQGTLTFDGIEIPIEKFDW